MSLVEIINTQLKLDVDKHELELERIISDQQISVDIKVNLIKDNLTKWGESLDRLKYWTLFVEERTTNNNTDGE